MNLSEYLPGISFFRVSREIKKEMSSNPNITEKERNIAGLKIIGHAVYGISTILLGIYLTYTSITNDWNLFSSSQSQKEKRPIQLTINENLEEKIQIKATSKPIIQLEEYVRR